MILTILMICFVAFILIGFSDAKPSVIIFTITFVLMRQIDDLYLEDYVNTLGYSETTSEILSLTLHVVIFLAIYHIITMFYKIGSKLYKKR